MAVASCCWMLRVVMAYVPRLGHRESYTGVSSSRPMKSGHRRRLPANALFALETRALSCSYLESSRDLMWMSGIGPKVDISCGSNLG